MAFIPGSRPEQIPTMGLIIRLYNAIANRLNFVPVYTVAQLQTTRLMLAKAVLIVDLAAFGVFRRDDADTTTADDGVDTILTADDVPVRFKRRTILRKYTPTSGTDTSMETGNIVYDTDFLYVKTASSTIEKIPLKLSSQGNLVASAGGGAPSQANYWSKLATVTSTGNYADVSAVFAIGLTGTLLSGTGQISGLIRLIARRDTTDWSYAVFMNGGYTRAIKEIRLVKVSDTVFEMWVQKSNDYTGISLTLVAQRISTCTINYILNASWQSTEPVSADSARDVKGAPESGTGTCATAARPATSPLPNGYNIFDTTLGKPIWWNGSNWKDATGTTV